MGSRERYKPPDNLIITLHRKGIFNLDQEASLELSSIWHQKWKNKIQLRLYGHEGELWENYTTKLKVSLVRMKGSCERTIQQVSHVRIKEVKNELV